MGNTEMGTETNFWKIYSSICRPRFIRQLKFKLHSWSGVTPLSITLSEQIGSSVVIWPSWFCLERSVYCRFNFSRQQQESETIGWLVRIFMKGVVIWKKEGGKVGKEQMSNPSKAMEKATYPDVACVWLTLAWLKFNISGCSLRVTNISMTQVNFI